MGGPWRCALRLAWRDARRSPLRTALVALLVGLPVLAATAADVYLATYHLNPVEQFARDYGGGASAALTWQDGWAVAQTDASGADWAPAGRAPRMPSLAALRRELGTGTRIAVETTSYTAVATSAGVALGVPFVGFDATGPILRGLVHQRSGVPARTAAEVVVDPQLARDAHVGPGSVLHLLYPSRRLRVVGIASGAAWYHQDAAFTPAPPAGAAPADTTTSYVVRTAAPVTWPEVRRLNREGFVVDSRWLLRHAGSRPAAPRRPATSGSGLATGAVIVGLALLEVVLLAGPAFVLIARRQERSLALVAAAGGRGRDLRNAVLASGVVLGAVGGVGGTAAGVGLGALAVPILASHRHVAPGPLGVQPLHLVAGAAVSLATALAAAAWPAWTASRVDPVAALAGRRHRRPARRAVLPAAALVAGAGAGATLLGGVSSSATLLVAGVALLEVGLILATPLLLAALAAASRRLPLSPRLALRDAGRNRSASAPAVAAVMAATLGAVAAVVTTTSYTAHGRAGYQAVAPLGEVVVYPDTGTTAAVVRAVRETLPGRDVAAVATLDCVAGGCPPAPATPVVPPGRTERTRVGAALATAPPVVAGPAALRALIGVNDPAAVRALAAGRALVPDAWEVHHGVARFRFSSRTPVSLPATVVSRGFAPSMLILPPSLVARTGLHSLAPEVLALGGAPTHRQLEALDAALARVAVAERPGSAQNASVGMTVDVETGYQDPYLAVTAVLVVAASVVALLAAGVAAGLSLLERADELRTLEAVGGAPVLRRRMAGVHAATLAGVGTLLGAAAGLVPSLALVDRPGAAGPAWRPAGGVPRLLVDVGAPVHLVVPALPLAGLVAGIPLLAGLVMAAVTRPHRRIVPGG